MCVPQSAVPWPSLPTLLEYIYMRLNPDWQSPRIFAQTTGWGRFVETSRVSWTIDSLPDISDTETVDFTRRASLCYLLTPNKHPISSRINLSQWSFICKHSEGGGVIMARMAQALASVCIFDTFYNYVSNTYQAGNPVFWIGHVVKRDYSVSQLYI